MQECFGQSDQPSPFSEIQQPTPYTPGIDVNQIQEPDAPHDGPTSDAVSPFAQLAVESTAASLRESSEVPPADEPVAEAAPRGYPYKQHLFTADDPLPIDKLSAELLKNWRAIQDTPMPHETPVTDEEWAEIQVIQQKVIDLGDKLGVDVRGRMLGREAHHFFDNYEAYDAAQQAIGDEDRSELGTEYTSRGIVCTRNCDDNPISKEHMLAHETLHSAAVHKVHMRIEEGEGKPVIKNDVKVGYQDVSNSFNETATDLLTHAILQELGDDDAQGYYPDCLLATNIIHKVAEHQGMDPADLARQIGRGLFTGDQTAMFYLDDTLGKEQIRAYLNGEHADVQDVINAAEALGLEDVVAEFKRLNSGPHEPVPILLSLFR